MGLVSFVSRSGGHKTKETYPTRPGSPTPCKQGLIIVFWEKPLLEYSVNNGEEKSLRHVAMVAKFLDDSKNVT